MQLQDSKGFKTETLSKALENVGIGMPCSAFSVTLWQLRVLPVLSAEHLIQPLNLQHLVLFYGRTSGLLGNQYHPSYLLSASSVLPPGLNEANCKTISFEYVSLILPYPLPFVCLQSYLIFNRYWFCEILHSTLQSIYYYLHFKIGSIRFYPS